MPYKDPAKRAESLRRLAERKAREGGSSRDVPGTSPSARPSWDRDVPDFDLGGTSRPVPPVPSRITQYRAGETSRPIPDGARVILDDPAPPARRKIRVGLF